METNAETKPLFNAVKNEDVKIFKPEKIKAKEKIRIALVVNDNNPWS